MRLRLTVLSTLVITLHLATTLQLAAGSPIENSNSIKEEDDDYDYRPEWAIRNWNRWAPDEQASLSRNVRMLEEQTEADGEKTDAEPENKAAEPEETDKVDEDLKSDEEKEDEDGEKEVEEDDKPDKGK